MEPCPYVPEIFEMKGDISAARSDISALVTSVVKIDSKLEDILKSQRDERCRIVQTPSKGYLAGIASAFALLGAAVCAGAEPLMDLLTSLGK